MDRKRSISRSCSQLLNSILPSQKCSQVWVETAIYTLVGLTLIAIILSVATPQLQKIKDKAVINDATDSFLLLNGKIIEVGEVAGNIRIVNFRINKGVLSVDSEGDKVIFSLENTNLKFSEPGSSIEEGDITYRTEEYGKRFTVSLDLTYEGFDITYKGNSELKVLHNGLHKIKLENQGFDEGSGKTKLDISLI